MKKILVVDDQFGIRILLKEMLEKEGYIVFQAANGQQAIMIVENDAPDLALLDLKLPGIGGIELLKRIKIIEPHIVTIMMTAYEELSLLKEAKRFGAAAYFSKPFDIKEVRKIIKEHLDSGIIRSDHDKSI